MKKCYTVLLAFGMLVILGSGELLAQSKKAQVMGEDFSPRTGELKPGIERNASTHRPKAPGLWDTQFGYSLTDSAGFGAAAGVAFTGTEFWVSKWNSDTISVHGIDGSFTSVFTIAGTSGSGEGTRGLAWDGAYMYSGNNTTSIRKIDPVSKAVVETITAPTNVRFIAYDSTADGGGGGFWVGNWDDNNIFLIDTNGTTLTTILATAHGKTGIYGVEFDNLSAGGPYLWLFDQSGFSQAEIWRMRLPGGAVDGIYRDVTLDFGTGGDGLAGDLFISDALVPGKVTLGGVLQDNPDVLFAYELEDSTAIGVNAEIAAFVALGGYTQIPISQAFPINFRGLVRNVGADTLTTVNMEIDVQLGGTSVFTDTQTTVDLYPGFDLVMISNSYTPTATGTYTVISNITLDPSQTDADPTNNSDTLVFEVTDSTYARDDGESIGGTGYFVSGDAYAWVVANFDVAFTDTLSSVWIQIETPISGDTTYALVANSPGGSPSSIIAQSDIQIISAGQNQYVLIFPNGVILTPGTYAIGIYEGTFTGINLSHSANNYFAGVNYFSVGGGPWFESGVETARFIRPNFGKAVTVGIDSEAFLEKTFRVYPNPSDGGFTAEFGLWTNSDIDMKVYDGLGRVVWTQELENIRFHKQGIDLSSLPSGIYHLSIESPLGNASRKLILTK